SQSMARPWSLVPQGRLRVGRSVQATPTSTPSRRYLTPGSSGARLRVPTRKRADCLASRLLGLSTVPAVRPCSFLVLQWRLRVGRRVQATLTSISGLQNDAVALTFELLNGAPPRRGRLCTRAAG